jgi:peroxiredoxin
VRAAQSAVCLPVVLALLALAACSDDLVVLRPGEAAPDFQLESLERGPVSLAGLRGRLVMVRFWADWCKSCRTEMPLIEEKYRAYHDRGFEVLAVNVRQSEETAGRFAREVGITYPVLLDRDGAQAGAWGVIGLPTTFLIDREGKILEEIIGDMNRRSLGELLDPHFDGEAGE